MRRVRRSLPRWSQQWWVRFALISAVTFLSFWPSFFSAIANVEAAVVIHGVSATGWMLLTVIQAWSLKSNWRKYHRTVGYVSLALAAILVLSGLQMLQIMILRDGGAAVGIPLLGFKFFYLDLTGLVLF